MSIGPLPSVVKASSATRSQPSWASRCAGARPRGQGASTWNNSTCNTYLFHNVQNSSSILEEEKYLLQEGGYFILAVKAPYARALYKLDRMTLKFLSYNPKMNVNLISFNWYISQSVTAAVSHIPMLSGSYCNNR